ncbi:MAG: dinitrogenase iron-molybdenum cofactor biosynthesis protein [Armatimonadetes bacterium]|nr:dinitrogenase iron-molybdenum cofactor biosynthesis protein [Armatimonadota bacterium]
MKIAVACDDTMVSPHFGRCDRYLIAEVEDADIRLLQWLDNPGHEPGALPELMRQQGVVVVVAGGAGPRAVQLLAQHGIDLVMGVSGDALEALQALAQGALQGGESACDHG